ncbi:hypothetical protein FNW25_03730 [Flavobacterium franklandianum]|uniref:TonB-dependent receptor plug domain-containing protein n=1 Tax=Flavobacterium franklandianum TaxID=2594430 RepID=A0A553CNX4_9FLAO|nr:hypothetical protein [Flavobacterium franklandianum]TRX22278.1 hypothetical protein FNW17_06310 [Flavobacterium franklandianum]TRX28874.1 hypothetical protein FNW25_03730 [Flavobacterium franklandianum]
MKGQSKINIALLEESNNLKELVIIGYGTQRKVAVTGSVASINGSTLGDVWSSNIPQTLQGSLAGVEIAQT